MRRGTREEEELAEDIHAEEGSLGYTKPLVPPVDFFSIRNSTAPRDSKLMIPDQENRCWWKPAANLSSFLSFFLVLRCVGGTI